MDRNRHERITALFLQASELPAGERDRFLERACGADTDLRREVEQLLEHDRKGGVRATERLAEPVGAAAHTLTLPDDRRLGPPGGASSGQPPGEGPKRIAQYRILGRLGMGGAGLVYEAHDERMDRAVALKVLSPTLAHSERATRRFEREAWIAGRLRHPNIVQVYERGDWEGHLYYAMELIGGGSLHDVIENMRRDRADARLGLRFGSAEYVHWAVRQVVQVARALAFAHRQGVVHRDIKPANLLLEGKPPVVRLADFGIAIDEDRTRMTTEGQVIGTICYMAPEQILGQHDRIDGRTDIYALGVTLFELLTLELPFRGDTHQRYIRAVLDDEARRPRRINDRVSRDLEVVIRKALEKSSRHRYATAAAFADDLENVLHLRPIQAQPPGLIDRGLKWVQRKPLQATLAGFLLIALPTVGLLTYRAVTQGRQLRRAEVGTQERALSRLVMGGEDAAMLAAAKNLLRLDPGSAMALRSLAVGNFNLAQLADPSSGEDGYRDEALRYVDSLIAAHPGIPGHYRLKADFLRQWGRDAEAAEVDRLADSIPPSDDEDSLYYGALSAYNAGDLERAEEDLSRLLVRRRRAEALLWRAKVRARLGRTEGAIEDYRAAIDLNPRDPLPHKELGRIFASRERFADARAHLERAVALDPDGARAHELYADYALRHGRRLRAAGDDEAAMARFREAEEHARRSVDIDPERPLAWLNLGASLVEQDHATGRRDRARLEQALEYFARAESLASSPAGGGAREVLTFSKVNMCDALIELRDGERAIASCQEVAALLQDNAAAHYNLAGAYMLAGRQADALAELQRDVELGDVDHAYLRADPWFAPLRDLPAFRDLLGSMERAAAKPAEAE